MTAFDDNTSVLPTIRGDHQLTPAVSRLVINFEVFPQLTYLVLHDLAAAPPLQYCLALVVAGSTATAKVATATTSQPPGSARDAPPENPRAIATTESPLTPQL